MNNYFIITSTLLCTASMFFGVWLGALIQRMQTETLELDNRKWNLDQVEPEQKYNGLLVEPEQQYNGLLGRLIVENARLRVRLDAIELPHATYKYVCTHCSHMFNIGRNQEVCICPACGGSSEN